MASTLETSSWISSWLSTFFLVLTLVIGCLILWATLRLVRLAQAPVGPAGVVGAAGPAGPAGAAGAAGPAGPAGVAGIAGPMSPAGAVVYLGPAGPASPCTPSCPLHKAFETLKSKDLADLLKILSQPDFDLDTDEAQEARDTLITNTPYCIITFQAIRVKDERNSWASLEDRTTKVDEALRLFNDLERACMVIGDEILEQIPTLQKGKGKRTQGSGRGGTSSG